MVIRRCVVALAILASAFAQTRASASTPMTLRVTPSASLFDAPLSILVRGAAPGSRVTLEVSSVDADGVTWSSHSTFVASTDGTVSPATARSIAGSYTGRDRMGPIDSMKPESSNETFYLWGAHPQVFTFTSTEGSQSAVTSIERRGIAPGVRSVNESIADTGFFGQFWIPPGAVHHPAVLEFGGSEGGLDGQLLGGLLASHGYPTLDIAYFGEPGLPVTLSNISLNYFATALRWLAKQPQVDPSKIFVSGGSRGSEAALLLGAYFPSLVHGVIAASPSDVAICSYPDCNGPAWSLNGTPLPFTSELNVTSPFDSPHAVIPVAKIKGPVLLVCGGADLVWNSCSYAAAIMTELNKAHDRRVHELFTYPDAGHWVDLLLPYEPELLAFENSGVSPLSNQLAYANLWPKVLAFLAARR